MGEILVKTLLETGQDVPDFLEAFIPEGYEPGAETAIDFDDNSSEEGSETGEAAEEDAAEPEADGAWGAAEEEKKEASAEGAWGSGGDSAGNDSAWS